MAGRGREETGREGGSPGWSSPPAVPSSMLCNANPPDHEEGVQEKADWVPHFRLSSPTQPLALVSCEGGDPLDSLG